MSPREIMAHFWALFLARYSRIAEWQWRFKPKKEPRSRIFEAITAAFGYRAVPAPLRMKLVNGKPHRIIRLPRRFSFIDNPTESLNFIASTVATISQGAPRVFFDQQKQQSMDLCAGALLNVVVKEAKDRFDIKIAGAVPERPYPLIMTVAAGLPAFFHLVEIELPNVTNFFEVGHKSRASGDESSNIEGMGDRLKRYISDACDGLGRPLAPGAISHLGKLIGEVIQNAKEYGDGTWWVAGFTLRHSSAQLAVCHLAFFNFGPTIAETVQRMKNPELSTEIAELIKAHEAKRFFEVSGHPWTRDALWTLFAMQEGVTSHASPNRERGTGTAELITAFQQLGSTLDPTIQPRMCLLSGSTHLLFDGKFPMKLMDGRRIMALNEENRLDLPPSRDAIRRLKRPFPGTLISIRFMLDSRPKTGTFSVVVP